MATPRHLVELTETLAGVLAREDVVAGAGAVHLLLVRDVVHLALNRDIDRLGGVRTVVLAELSDRDGVVLASACRRQEELLPRRAAIVIGMRRA